MPRFSATAEAEHYVKDTPELRRILSLPRRGAEADPHSLAEELTELLKKPHGTMKLRPVQALSLYEIGTVGGLFGPQRVGSGKTAISFLAPVVAFAKRPLLLIPAKLMIKTRRDLSILSQHWDIGFIRIMTYEWLGRVQADDALERYQPDIIIADECHKLRNIKGAAVAKRVNRYFRKHDHECKCVAMSGTITKRSLHDYAHILQWVYKPDLYPLPQTFPEREVWADALDVRKSQHFARPGALSLFCIEDEEKNLWRWDSHRAARRAFRRHFVATPGIVATHETPIDASLNIQSLEADVNGATEDAFRLLRNEWMTPDEWPLLDGLEIFRHARELAMGFFYRWDPRAPVEWAGPRKVWAKFVREKIKNSNQYKHYDSELQVRQAFPNAQELLDWLAVKNSFQPNTVPVWLDDYLIDFVGRWVDKNQGIVWTEHTCVGERLSKELGITYYGRRGMSDLGEIIEQHKPGQPLIASVQSNGEGRNLQAWSSMLILSMPPNGTQSEQLLGRLHRDGQEADEVQVDILMSCSEHVEAFAQAKRDAEYVFDTTGSPQKLLDATVNVLTAGDIALRDGHRWA